MPPPSAPLVLTYFDDNKGRNELVRLIFVVGEVPFVDELIGFSEYVRRRDAKQLPFDQIPTLRVGDTVLGQSCAIARYAAKLAKLYPEDALSACKADAVVDAWRDQLDLLYDTFFERTVIAEKLQMFPRQQVERAQRVGNYFESSFKPWMRQMEKLLDGRRIAASLSFAELAIFDLVSTLEGFVEPEAFKQVMDLHPEVRGLVQEIGALPSVQQHLVQHPYQSLRELMSTPSNCKRHLESLLFPCLKAAMASWLGLKRCCSGDR
ncbi:unnamed protein product [Durusdinium trenchii]